MNHGDNHLVERGVIQESTTTLLSLARTLPLFDALLGLDLVSTVECYHSET